MLTNATLTDSDIAEFENLGQQMSDAVVSGIENSTAASMSYWEMLFGGLDQAKQNPEYHNLIELLGTSYDESLAQAESIGQGMRDAMTSAFADGKISEEEYQNILNYMQSYNEAMAQAELEAQNQQDYIDQQKLLHKAQTASLDEIKDVAKEIEESRDTALANAEDTYLTERYAAEYKYNQAIQNGTLIDGQQVTESMRDSALAEIDAKYQQHVLG